MMELKRSVIDEEHGLTFDKLIELTRVTGRSFYLSDRFRWHEERDEKEMSSAKMDQSCGQFLGMYLVSKHCDQMPVPSHGDLLLKVRVMQDEDVWSVALWNFDETYILRWTDNTVSDVSAMLTQIDRYKEQFVSIKFRDL